MSDIDKRLDEILVDRMWFIEQELNVGQNVKDVLHNAKDELQDKIKQLMVDEVKKARIDELNRISADPGEVIPYKHDSFAMGMNFYQSRIADRLAELKGDDK